MSVHDELRDSARQVLTGLGPASAEDATWKQIVDLGWLLVSVSEELGGLGIGLSGACVIYSELGRTVAAAPFLPAMLAIEAVCASDIADREAWIERLTTGFSVTAPLAPPSLSVKNGKLNGAASAVPSADKADHILICTPDCVALASLAGAEMSARSTWDETRRLFDVRFNDVAIDDATILVRGAKAQELSTRIATHRDFALAADAVGGAAALLAITVDYLQTRRQFGRPLAMFQALKHRCADLKAQTVAAEALLIDSLNRVEQGGDAELLGKIAKQVACATYARVGEEAIQLHGGIAMTAEHVCHLYVKRALLNEHLGPASDTYELEIAASVLGAKR